MASPLHVRLAAHAVERPDELAVCFRDTELTWADLLAEVDTRAGALGPGWTVLREDDRLAFVVDYLAAARAGAPVVIAEHAAPPHLRADEARALCPGGAEVLFTSGSSATAKAVLLDGAQLARKAEQINAALPGSDGVEVLSLPLRHSFGLGRLRCALSAGRTVVLTDRLSSPGAVFDALDRWPRATFGFVSSTVKLLLARHRDALAHRAPAIAQIEIGSEPLEEEYRRQLAELLPGTALHMHYGMTELSRIAMVDLRDPRTAGTAGWAMPDTELRVRDTESGDLRPHGTGDLCVRGAAMVRAHLDDNGLVPVDPGSWLPTGDHGTLTEDGLVVVTGRRSNVVKILGEKVVLEDTERAIGQFADGLRGVCVPAELTAGVSILVAVVEVPPGPALDRSALHEFLRDRLPAHQVPRRIVAVPQLPRLANGKLDRQAVAALVTPGANR